MTEGTAPAIVYLDADDEITSAAARLRGLEGDEVVFVLPYGSRLSTSRINFRLLAREAASRGKRLVIVAADASARALAGTAGLPVHASVAAFEGRDPAAPQAAGDAVAGVASASGPAPIARAPASDGSETRVLTLPRSAEPVPVVGRKRPIVRPRTALVAALILLLLAGGGGLAAFLYLPSATIVLHPATQALGPFALSVSARADIASPDPTALIVPAHQYSFELAASQTFTTTGRKISETAAEGSVTFTWYGNQTGITIPAGTVVTTASGTAFATQSQLVIRRAHVGGASTGNVGVTAANRGTAGNVAAGAITQMPSNPDPNLLKVVNPQPTSGGTHTETPQVSQQDVNTAVATLNQALRDDLATQIAQPSGVPRGTTLLEATGKVGAATPSVDPSTLVGQAVATFDLGLTASGTVLGVDTAPVQALAAQQLASRITPGWQLVDGSTTIEVGRPSVSGDSITFAVTAGAREIHAVDRAALLAQIKGLDLPRARAILDGYGAVQISLWPGWVTTIPGDTGRISLTIDTGGSPGPGATTAPSTSPGPGTSPGSTTGPAGT